MRQDRRSFFGTGFGLVVAGSMAPRIGKTVLTGAGEPAQTFPRQDPTIVEEMVRVAHFDLARVKQLVESRPALARAAVDWGFGDWEDALGAASHTGRREIADVLIAHGARPTIFSAAMMGQLEVVKAFVAVAPGCQSILGPHGITLLAHAKAGGEPATAVRAYLELVGGADPKPPTADLPAPDREKYVGTYEFGSLETEILVIANDKNGLSISRPGLPFPRPLRPVGRDEFAPMGADSVRIKFEFRNGGSASLSVLDPTVLVTASRRR